MSFIDYVSERIIARGYDYFESDMVLEVEQTDTYEYRGLVKGSRNEPYSVMINTKNHKAAVCDCPYAEGGNICKHMVALYLAAFPEEADQYEYCLDSYDEYNDYDDYDDKEYSDWKHYSGFELRDTLQDRLESGEGTLYYDELLEVFLNSLSLEEMRKTLKAELNENKTATFNKYLKSRYTEYMDKKGDASKLIDALNARLILMAQKMDSDWKDYSQPILSDQEKARIVSLWSTKKYEAEFNELFMKEGLAVYSDYQWIAGQLHGHLTELQKTAYVAFLNDHLNDLKRARLRATVPKSNVLICISIITALSDCEIAELMVRNVKYSEFVSYCVENARDIGKLYESFQAEASRKPLHNKQFMPSVLRRFYDACNDQDILHEYYLYKFLSEGSVEPLQDLKNAGCLECYGKRIESMTKSLSQLVTLYRFTGEMEKLYDLLMEKGSLRELIGNTDILRDKYETELKDYYTEGFFSQLTGEKKRDVYYEAAKYIEGLVKLKRGDEYVDQIISRLHQSQYEKCRALFEEIDLAAGRREPSIRFHYRYRSKW